MATRLAVKIDGTPAVVRALQAIGLAAEEPRTALDAIARDGAQLASDAAPRLTGTLAGSITGRREGNRAVISTAALPYAGVINFGWAQHNIAAAGFMQAADERLTSQALRHIENDLNHAIEQQGLT